MSDYSDYRYLEARPSSSVRQPFVKGRGIWAEVLYRETIGVESRTPEEVARDFEVPLEAVLEAIHFCTTNQGLLREQREALAERTKEFEKKYPPLRPPTFQPSS